ncbi:MAG TPA: 30S ribosomal protein S15 [Candidatus Diapherotrites archaeon]|nr:30S ribosomal protein S15 [Candidatus Diapherotrites archaeon]
MTQEKQNETEQTLEISEKSNLQKKGKQESQTKTNKEEIYSEIENLTKKGESNAKIGLELKKKKIYTKHTVGKKIGQIQKEMNLSKNKIPDDLMALIKQAVQLLKHREKNKKDMAAKRGYQLTVSKINRLTKYYIKQGKLPNDWRYSEETAKLLVK